MLLIVGVANAHSAVYSSRGIVAGAEASKQAMTNPALLCQGETSCDNNQPIAEPIEQSPDVYPA